MNIMLKTKPTGDKLLKLKKIIGAACAKKMKTLKDFMRNGLKKMAIVMKTFTALIQKGLPTMKNKEKQLQDLYDKVFEQSIKHIKKHNPQMGAGTLMAIAIRLYKTNLTDDGFHEMLQTVLDSEDKIRPYDDKETLH